MLFRSEKFDEEYDFLRERLGLGKAPERINISQPGAGYRYVCNEESSRIISRIYAQDIALLGYSFDG